MICLKTLVFFCLLFGQSLYAEELNYKILGISSSASQEEIKKAYRREARKWHPDQNPGNPEAEKRFKEIQNAYEVLKNAESRETYDRYGHTAYTESSERQSTSPFSHTFKDIFNGSAENQTLNQKETIRLFKSFSFFQKTTVEDYSSLLKKKQEGLQLSAEEKSQLKEYNAQKQKDIRIFKKILSKMALPSQTHHPILLEAYLDALKLEWIQKNSFNSSISQIESEIKGQRLSNEFSFNEKAVERALNQIKSNFDLMHYEGLKRFANPISLHSLKGFPVQFLLFSFAIGSSTYVHSLYEKSAMGAESKPGELVETVQQLSSPFGIFSFFVFVAASQQIHYRLYGLGRWMDGKSLRTLKFNGKSARALAPSLGLGGGYMLSTALTGLWQDPYFGNCVKDVSGFSKDSSNLIDHMSPCENFYLNWKANEQWKSLGVDMLTLIGASIISHKFISHLAFLIGKSSAGAYILSWLIRTVGQRALGYIGFAVHFFSFVEFHKLLDDWLGKPIKKENVSHGVKSSLVSLNSAITKLLKEDSSNSWLKKESPQYQSLKKEIHETGYRLENWTRIMNQDYQYSYFFWTQNINKKMINYEVSIDFLEEIFKSLESTPYSFYNNRQVIYETALEVNGYLSQIDGSFPVQDYVSFKQDYVSFEEDELFSSNPKFSIEALKYSGQPFNALNYEKWFVLARELIQSGLDIENSLSGLSDSVILKLQEQKLAQFQDLAQQEDIAQSEELAQYFWNPESHQSEIASFCSDSGEYCHDFFNSSGLNAIQEDRAIKLLVSGFYLLRNMIPDFYNSLGHNQNIKNHLMMVLDKVSPLVDRIEVYKSGEEFFLTQDPQIKKSLKENLDSSLIEGFFKDEELGQLSYIVRAMLCGAPTKKEVFNVPHFFKDQSQEIKIYDFKTKDYRSLDCRPWSQDRLYKLLFQTPSQYRGAPYETLYLVLQKIIDESYTSREDLIEDYAFLSKEELSQIRESSFEELKILKEKYYIKSIRLEDSPVNSKSSLDDFLEYYNEDRVKFSWCKLSHHVTFGVLFNECQKGLKEVEISIFRVNYWLKILKKLLEKGEDLKICEEGSCVSLNQKALCKGNYGCEMKFDSDSFKTTHTQVLSCLQSQHDFFKPDSQSSSCNKDSEALIDEVLSVSDPSKATALKTFLFNNNKNLEGEYDWSKLLYSVRFELYKSLKAFEGSIAPLKLREYFKNQISSAQSF